MASKRQLPPSSDGAGSSRPSKCLRSTPCSSGNTACLTRQELEALVEKLLAENKELKEKLSISQGCIDVDEITSEPAGDGRYEIRFLGTIKERVYTNSNLKGEDGKPLKVEILYNGKRITQGPFASAKFEIVVVKGDFYVKDHEGWSVDEFQGSLVEVWRQMGPILAGNCRSKFSDGEAVLSGLKFKKSSHWAKWQLGIRILGDFTVRVLEAISEPFQVFDRRSKANEKPHPPLLTAGVQCLEKVGKQRASDLCKNKVRIVKDFLQFLHLNPSSLLQILDISSDSDESWKTMIGHAKECNVGPSLYYYRKDDYVLFFNSVYEVVGAEFGNHYRSIVELVDHEKEFVDKLKEEFFKNIKNRDFTADFGRVNGHVPVKYDDDALRDEIIFQVQGQEGSSDSCPVINSEREILGSQDAFPQFLTESQSPPLMNDSDIIEVLTIINAEPNNDKAWKRLMLVIFFVLSTKNSIKRAHLAKMSRILNFVRA